MVRKITPKFKIGQKVHITYYSDYYSDDKFACGTIMSFEITHNTKLKKGVERTTTSIIYMVQFNNGHTLDVKQKDIYSNKSATFLKARNDRKAKASRAFKKAENALKRNTKKLQELKEELKLLEGKKYESKKRVRK